MRCRRSTSGRSPRVRPTSSTGPKRSSVRLRRVASTTVRGHRSGLSGFRAHRHGIEHRSRRWGKPVEGAFASRFDDSSRDERLHPHDGVRPRHADELSGERRDEDAHARSHAAFRGPSPTPRAFPASHATDPPAPGRIVRDPSDPRPPRGSRHHFTTEFTPPPLLPHVRPSRDADSNGPPDWVPISRMSEPGRDPAGNAPGSTLRPPSESC